MKSNNSSSSSKSASSNKPKNSNRSGFSKNKGPKNDRRNDKPKKFGNSLTAVKTARKEAKNNAKKKNELNPNLLIQRAQQVVEEVSAIETRFDEMNIHPAILGNLRTMGFEHPTEIQIKTYDKLVEGENLIGIAN